MAYAAVVSLAQTLDQILNHDKYSPISFPENQEIISLSEHAISLQAILEDFPEKATSLEGRIREVANKLEDIIEYYLMRKSTVVGPLEAKFRCQVRKVAEEMKSIVGRVMEHKDSGRSEEDSQLSDSPPAAAASSISRLAPTVKNSDIVGLDEDTVQILNRLRGFSSGLQILPIVGMGGIGKTTLASFVYHHPSVIDHFDIRAWVTISQDYNVQEILSSLLDSMGVQEEDRSGQSIGSMAENVSRRLVGRRYLIIIDDGVRLFSGSS